MSINVAQDAKDWPSYFQQSLAELESNGLRRTRRVVANNRPSSVVQSAHLGAIDFSSNDYLGLRRHPDVIAAASAALETVGLGVGASPLVSGYQGMHAELEMRFARSSKCAASLVFSSGFACNAGVIPCLLGAPDAILSDQLNHASLIDGCRLSRAKTIVFPHADSDAVKTVLQAERHRFRRVIIVTESVFSMDGDVAPLAALAEVAEAYEAGLIVDEAHATGIYGKHGAGMIEELGLEHRVLVKLGTLSKALGGVGGYVCGSEPLIEFLVNRCRSYIYSTALPPSIVAGAIAALKLSCRMNAERANLRAKSRMLRSAIRASGWHVPDGDSPIVPVIVGQAQDVVDLSRSLLECGYFVPAIRPPTVPECTARLRISLSVAHSAADIVGLIQTLAELSEKG